MRALPWLLIAACGGGNTGGGIGFMYDGPLARMDGVMHTPRSGMKSFGRANRARSRILLSRSPSESGLLVDAGVGGNF